MKKEKDEYLIKGPEIFIDSKYLGYFIYIGKKRMLVKNKKKTIILEIRDWGFIDTHISRTDVSFVMNLIKPIVNWKSYKISRAKFIKYRSSD